jgi:hypothetical protein
LSWLVEYRRRTVGVHDRPARVDEVTLARVGREREEAGLRLAKTREVLARQWVMSQLDAEEQTACSAN